MTSHLFFRASPAKTAPALLSRVLVVTGISSVIFGCGSLPMTRVEDASVVELRLLPHTRLLKPGDASRFTVRIENRGSKTLSLDGLALTLEAWKLERDTLYRDLALAVNGMLDGEHPGEDPMDARRHEAAEEK